MNSNLNSNINEQVAGIGYSKSDPTACGPVTLIEDGAYTFNEDKLGVGPEIFGPSNVSSVGVSSKKLLGSGASVATEEVLHKRV